MSVHALAQPATNRPHRHFVHGPSPRNVLRISAKSVAIAVGFAAVLTLFGARCVQIARADSITSDESTYLAHSLHYWMTGDDLDMWELGSPRLPHTLNALASCAALRPLGLPKVAETTEARRQHIQQLLNSGMTRVLVPARCVGIAWGLALLIAVFWGVARVRGAFDGLIAAGLLAMVPEVAAHASIAGSDMPFTAAAFIALVLMARYAERPTAARWIALGLAIGLAWAMRHAALILLPIASGVHLLASLRNDRPRGVVPIVESLFGSAAAVAGLSLIAYIVLWAGDGFGTVTLADVSSRVTTLNVPERVGPFDISRIPLPTSALSILKQVRHQSHGHEAYLCGAYGTKGWPLYFPIAFLLKTPLGLLLLMVVAAARVRLRGSFEFILLASLAVLWLMLVRNKVNIGVRYALLTYPLVVPIIARLFEPAFLRDRVWGPMTLCIAGWFVWASLACGGRCLSYFNEIGGGPSRGWMYLADSNIDWGQDLNALAAKLRELRIKDVTTDLSTERRLEMPDLVAVTNPPKALQVPTVTPPNRRLYDSEGGYLPVYTRYVAVSVSRLLGLYSQNDMSWLRTRKLVARVRDSVFLFDMDRPADHNFCD
jgi:4-amino-4-deoxy-L-arabinose transferase-like glycosyltransferase